MIKLEFGVLLNFAIKRPGSLGKRCFRVELKSLCYQEGFNTQKKDIGLIFGIMSLFV